MTGQGGWPLNVFLTPDQVPFYGGTYFPPEPRHGMPVLAAGPARGRRGAGASAARRSRATPRRPPSACAAARACSRAPTRSAPALLDAGGRRRSRSHASTACNGGWGAARRSSRRLRRSSSCWPAASPRWRSRRCARWPPAGSTTRSAAASPATASTRPGPSRTSRRCSTTTRCSHGRICTAGSSSGDPLLRRTCEETLDWALREMRAPDGGFYSALDADSEGVEGRFYVWTTAELSRRSAPTPDAALAWFGASDAGNFPEGPAGRERPRVARPGARPRGARADPRPSARGARATRAPGDRRQARRELERADGRGARRRRRRARAAGLPRRRPRDRRLPARRRSATATGGCCARYNRGERQAARRSSRITRSCWRRCSRSTRRRSRSAGSSPRARPPTSCSRASPTPSTAGSSRRPTTREQLVARRKELEDAPIPSGGASAALGLLRLALLTGEAALRGGGARAPAPRAPAVRRRHPQAFAHTLQAIDLHVGPAREVALVGATASDRSSASCAARCARDSSSPAAAAPRRTDTRTCRCSTGRHAVDGRAAAYVCERFACRAPETAPHALATLLD